MIRQGTGYEMDQNAIRPPRQGKGSVFEELGKGSRNAGRMGSLPPSPGLRRDGRFARICGICRSDPRLKLSRWSKGISIREVGKYLLENGETERISGNHCIQIFIRSIRAPEAFGRFFEAESLYHRSRGCAACGRLHPGYFYSRLWRFC